MPLITCSTVEKAAGNPVRMIDGTFPFGVYILTYPGDFHLAKILVCSIRHVSPDVPIMIIPGEGFDRDVHPFDVPIMATPSGSFWPELGHMDRKFWSFQGPFETFLYLDADTICTRTLDQLIERITRQRGNFIYVQPWINDWEWRSAIRDPSHRDHASYAQQVKTTIGRGPLQRFDPDHDFTARYPFNAGVFASRRLTIKEADLASLNQEERKFYREVLGVEEWTWQCSTLFFRDQGRLNYLVCKLSIPVLPLRPDLICRSGASSTKISFAEIERGCLDWHIIHWMGAKSPSPSYFCTMPLFRTYAYLWSFVGRRTGRWIAPGYERLSECVGYSLWRHHHDRSFGPLSLRARLRWSWRDLLRTCRLSRRFVKITAGAVRRRLGGFI
jgi:hypothetical protein